jgi:hypothetical protein
LAEADDAAGTNVDCRKKVHYRSYGNHRVEDSCICPARDGAEAGG